MIRWKRIPPRWEHQSLGSYGESCTAPLSSHVPSMKRHSREEGNGAGVSGWGWNDDAYGTLAAPVYFATPGLQTIRLQQREDGIMWDQLALSAGTYFSTRPGLTRSDSTVVAAAAGSGMVTSHAYPAGGQYPVSLTVTDNDGASATAQTTAVIK